MAGENLNKSQAFQGQWLPMLGEPHNVDKKKKILESDRATQW
jgi:hypothetical protein